MPSQDPASTETEVALLHDAYERALAAHDPAALTAFFWDSSRVVRFGIAEVHYGADALADYRRTAIRSSGERRLLRRTIVALAPTVVSVMCEFLQIVGDRSHCLRQSQVWLRMPGVGWRIAAAHVSHAANGPQQSAWEAFAVESAAAIGLPLAAVHREGTAQNLQQIASIAAPLLSFALPDREEPAPIYVP